MSAAANFTLTLAPPSVVLTSPHPGASTFSVAIASTAVAVSSLLHASTTPVPSQTGTAWGRIDRLDSSSSSASDPQESGGDTDGCNLLSSSFGWWLQLVLGAVCFVTLAGKRFTDKVRRPWKIWFYDTSKQGLSALVVHFANILLSMAFGHWLEVDADPCNWYWINLTLDDTLGVAIAFLLLRCLQCFYRLRCVGRPELARSGDYGDPPACRIFLRQLLDWQLLALVQKCILATLVLNFTDTVVGVAGFLLGWLDHRPRAKLVVVMVITPLVANVFALWMADNFLQSDPTDLAATDAPARERLVSAVQGDVVGRQPSLRDEYSEDEDRVMGFQEWKRRLGAIGQKRPSLAAPPCSTHPASTELASLKL